MTDDQDAGGPPQGRRHLPTIDLIATEVANEPTAADAGPTAAEGAAAAPHMSASAASGSPRPELESPEPARPESEQRVETKGSGRKARLPWLGAGVAGGVLGGILALALFLMAGQFLNRDDANAALDARLTGAEAQLRDLAGRPQRAGADPKIVDDLVTRVARLETAAAPGAPGANPALANRISTLEGQLKALSETVSVLGRRNDEAASAARDAQQRADANAAALADITKKLSQPAATVDRSQIDALINRVATVERSVKTLQDALSQRAAGEGSDRAVRLSLAANALRAAVERGASFTTELAAAKALAADAKTLAPLEPFAATGVPTAAALAKELTALTPAMTQAAGGTANSGGILDRLRANAEKIVRVQRVDDIAGDDPAAIIARVDGRASRADLAGALAELAKLPDPARAPAQSWIDKVQARSAAVDAAQRFANDALAALGKS